MKRERNNLWSWRLRFDHHNVENFAVNAIKNVTNLELSFFVFFYKRNIVVTVSIVVTNIRTICSIGLRKACMSWLKMNEHGNFILY